MTAAEFAAGLGLRVCVIERDRAGGDCLWTGCVPSKALIAAANAAHLISTADRFGLASHALPIDPGAVWAYIRSVRDRLAAGDDDPARFAAMGVDIRWGSGRIVGSHEVAVTDNDGSTERVTTRVILVCTGSRPLIPNIDGLEAVGYLTTETLFELEAAPHRLIFIGGGPVAIELAQACARLQLSVTVLEADPQLLGREEPDLVEELAGVLRRDGVELVTGIRIDRVEDGPTVVGTVDGVERAWIADAVVVATGRRVQVESLGLEAVGVAMSERGIVVDGRGRTAVPSIYASGDVVGRELFTHAAAHQAVMAVRDAFFPGRAAQHALVPWTTFTDPELAHAGKTIAEATTQFGRRRVRVHRWSLDHNDRAHTELSEGSIVLIEHVRWGRRRIVGGHVLSAHAGELIGELVLAIDRRMSVSDLGGLIHVYPTIATSIQQLGGRAAVEQAQKYRWLMKIAHRRRSSRRIALSGRKGDASPRHARTEIS